LITSRVESIKGLSVKLEEYFKTSLSKYVEALFKAKENIVVITDELLLKEAGISVPRPD
jgi:hypothetical protein